MHDLRTTPVHVSRLSLLSILIIFKKIGSVIHKGNKNNFASHECGAKVVATNPEAKVIMYIIIIIILKNNDVHIFLSYDFHMTYTFHFKTN